MSFAVQIRRSAELEVAEAQLWYETQRSGLGAEFLSEVSQVLDRLAETPQIYQIVYRDVRRAIVYHFPYLIWYRVRAWLAARSNRQELLAHLTDKDPFDV